MSIELKKQENTVNKRRIGVSVDLIQGKILKSLLIFAVPILISNIFQQLYNTMDTMIVGNCLGDKSLAAIGACSAVNDLLVGFGLGFGSGLSIVVSRYYGAKDQEMLKRSVAGAIVITAGITVLLMFISAICVYPLLQLLSTPSDIINESYSYIRIITMFCVVHLFYNLCAGILRATGNSVMPLVFLIISSGLNIFLDLFFIIVLHSGVEGAAVATVIAQGVSVILCIIYIIKRCPSIIPKKEHFAVGAPLFKELFGQGLSMGLMFSIVSSGTVILQSSINKMGYLIVAGHTAARKLSSFSFMPITTIATALSTFVSQNKGADQGERIIKSIKIANLIAIGWAVIISSLLFFLAPFLVQILSGSGQAVVIDNGSRYLMINAPFYAVLGILFNYRYSLQAIGVKILPLVSSVIELLGKILFVIFFIPGLHYFGVIICEPVIWCFMSIQLFIAYCTNPYIRTVKKKKQSVSIIY